MDVTLKLWSVSSARVATRLNCLNSQKKFSVGLPRSDRTSPNVFQVHAADGGGHVVLRKRVSRAKLLAFFAAQPRCTVALEACAGAHRWLTRFSTPVVAHRPGQILRSGRDRLVTQCAQKSVTFPNDPALMVDRVNP
jgi:hypothetical protein